MNNTVGHQDVQRSVGSITGKGVKGLFVTTAKFSKASHFLKHQYIILTDGEKLTKLMIGYNFGVSIKKTFEIKAIDIDTFNDYMD